MPHRATQSICLVETIDSHVLNAVGYDPEEYTGFAFGLGIERVCMRRHGIDDIRELYKNDVRFLHQF